MEGGAGVARRCTRSRASRRMTVGVASRPRKAALGLGASCFTGANEPVQSVVKPFPFFSLRSLLKPKHESSFCRSTYLIRTNPLHRCASLSLFPSSSSSLPALFSCPCPVSIVEIPLSIYPEQSSLSFSRPFFVTPFPPPSSPLIILLYKRMKPFKQRSRSFCGGCKAKTKGGSARTVTLFTGGVLTPHRLALRFVAPSLPSCFWSCKTSTHPQAPLSLKLESCSSDSSLHSPVFSFEPVALSFLPTCLSLSSPAQQPPGRHLLPSEILSNRFFSPSRYRIRPLDSCWTTSEPWPTRCTSSSLARVRCGRARRRGAFL